MSTQSRLWRVLDVLLFFMVVGPWLAPLMVWQPWTLLKIIGFGVIRLGHWICPQPHKAWMLLGYDVAVCARCLAAATGILLVRMAWPRQIAPVRWWQGQAWVVRLALVALAIAQWQSDVWGEYAGLWLRSDLWMVAGGLLLGIPVGALICSLIALTANMPKADPRPLVQQSVATLVRVPHE